MSPENARYSPATDPFYQEKEPPRSPDGAIVSADTLRQQRVPPGQVRTRKWPVLHASTIPQISTETWTLRIDGLVERPLQLGWREFKEWPRAKVFADFHCVTRWSRLGNLWEGVRTAEIAARAGVLPEARFVIVAGYDSNWSTNLPLSDFLSDDALIADEHDGRPLTADHGAPARLVVPRLYAWKSAKWVKSLTFVSDDLPGYWELLGYHDRGDPWTEQRFR